MVYIILSVLLFTLIVFTGASAARNIDPRLSTAFTNLLAALTSVALFFHLFSKETVVKHKFGVIMAAITGLGVTLFTLTINRAYALNKVAVVVPVVFGGTIVLSALLGHILFKEKISLYQALGLVFVVVGIGFVVYARASGK